MPNRATRFPGSAADSALKSRLAWLTIGLVLVFAALALRLVQLQIWRHDELAAKAAKIYSRPQKIPAKRGAIYDRNGELLARNQSVYTLYADSYHLRDHNVAVRGLAAAENLSPAEIRRKYGRKTLLQRYRFHLSNALHQDLGMTRAELDERFAEVTKKAVVDLATNLEEDAFRSLRARLLDENLAGLDFRRETRRFYPSPNRLAHVLGFVGSDSTGKSGVERGMDRVLRGINGLRHVQRDSRGREIAAYRSVDTPAQDGRSIRLTIDMGLQEIVERSLQAAFARHRPEKICAIWMNPRSGEILALANRPHFDLATRQGNRRNFAVQDQYEPGSTFKIVALGAAIDRGLVLPESPVFCHHGEFWEAGHALRDSHAYGELTVTQIVAKSSNVGAYQVARMLGPERFYDAAIDFGFNRATRVRLSAEAPGMIAHPSKWSPTSFSRMAIGYEVAVTPLQMLNALCVVANGGDLLRPRIVHAVGDSATLRDLRGRALSRKSAFELTRTLVAVTQPGGTAPAAQVPGFLVAGKTGTARKYSAEHAGYLPGRYVVSFCGFLPANDPQLAGIVVIDDPQGSAAALTGGSIAAPIFAEMAQKAVAYLDLQPNPSHLSLAQDWR